MLSLFKIKNVYCTIAFFLINIDGVNGKFPGYRGIISIIIIIIIFTIGDAEIGDCCHTSRKSASTRRGVWEAAPGRPSQAVTIPLPVHVHRQ